MATAKPVVMVAPTIDTSDPAIHFAGRFDRSDPKGPKFAWPGTSITARFSGTDLAIRLADTSQPTFSNAFTVVVDGVAKRVRVNSAHERYVLAQNLPNAAHEVTVFKSTESLLGTTQFLGFDFGQGELLRTPAKKHKIEIIGDSIACGYGVEAGTEKCHFAPDWENAYDTYGAVAARAMDADLSLECWSGKGIYRNNDGTQILMPLLYSRTIPTAFPAYDFSDTPPDVVVLSLGTNDFAFTVPPEREFETAFSAFLATVREKYPTTRVILTSSPMLTGMLHATHLRFLEKLAAAQPDPKPDVLDFPTQSPGDGVVCDRHPSKKTHQKMADVLVAEITRTR